VTGVQTCALPIYIGVLTDPQHRLKLIMARGRMTVNHLV